MSFCSSLEQRCRARASGSAMSLRFAAITTSLLCLACSGAPAAEVAPAPTLPAPVPAADAEPTPAPLTVEHRPELAERIAATGYQGTFAVLVGDRLIVSDPALAEQGMIPASTFKIPNSLISLELGVIDGPETTLAWDGVERWLPAWNRDHDLRSAFANSVVWYYQELARRIGRARMQEWLTAIDYGNATIGDGPVDGFWLNGPLRISAREQVEFLRRLHAGETPFSPATVEAFLGEVMIVDPKYGLRAKTGWADSSDFADPASAGFVGNLGWYVGSVEPAPGGERVFYATWLIAPEPAPESFSEDRKTVSLELLCAVGHGPAGRC